MNAQNDTDPRPRALTLYRYQRKWLNDSSRFKVGMFARQTGKSLVTSLEIVLECLRAEAAGRSLLWLILSASERQAKEVMHTYIQRHLKAYRAVFKMSSLTHLDNVTMNAATVEFPHGARIVALASNPDTARGFSGNVWLDEFAFHPHSHDLWRALFPVVSAGYRLIVTSTPAGRHNKFFDLMSSPVFSRHRVDIYQAINDGLRRNPAALKEAIGDPQAWAAEYELDWTDRTPPWLSEDLLQKSATAGILERYEGGACFVGIDVARRRDLWVAIVLERKEHKLFVRRLLCRQNLPFQQQYALIDEIFREYAVGAVHIDQTGLGEAVVEEVQRRHGAKRVKGILFTPYMKHHLATLLRQGFEAENLKIPADQPALMADLGSLRKTFSEAGLPQFIVDRTITDGHGDRFWALSLAVNAALCAPHQPLRYTPVARGAFPYKKGI